MKEGRRRKGEEEQMEMKCENMRPKKDTNTNQ